MYLSRFWNTKDKKDFLCKDGKTFFVESKFNENSSYIGEYDVFDGDLYAIYSFNKKNYLYLKNRRLEITNSITVKADVNWSKEELSSFEIYDNFKLLTKVIYKNIHEGILMPFDMIENWDEVNFGYELETLVNRVHREPEIILFPNQSNSSS